jgi:hypothetical protein
MHESFIHVGVQARILNIWNWLLFFAPNIGFVSDIIAYQAAIIAIAIPLSFEIISRISERYQSGVITKEFNRQWQFRLLIFLVLVDACLGVLFNFFVTDQIVGLWKLVAWLIFFLFISTNVILLSFFDTLRKYATQTGFLVQQLTNDLENVLNHLGAKRKVNNKKLSILQRRFTDSLEGIGDILAFEVRQKRNEESVRKGLQQLQKAGKKLFELKKEKNNDIEKILYSPDLFRLQKLDQIEASLQLAFLPEKHSIALAAVTNQFLRVRRVASEIDDLEIVLSSDYNLIQLLKHLSQIENNEQSVGMLLGVLRDLRYSYSDSRDDSVYYIYIGWYITSVFDKKFDIEYLSHFNRDFSSCARQIVSKDRSQLFNQLVDLLHSSIKPPPQASYILDNFDNRLMTIDYEAYCKADRTSNLANEIEQLQNLSRQIKTLKELNICLELCDKLKSIIEANFTRADQQSLNHDLTQIKKHTEFRLKLNTLRERIFDLGAYCIFKNKFDYIYQLWTFKQPEDADANWLGIDIVPQSLTELFDLCFGGSCLQNSAGIHWEDHYGSSRYYNLYTLILCLREFLRTSAYENGSYQSLNGKVKMPFDAISYTLAEIKNIAERLLLFADQIKEMKDQLSQLKFDGERVDKIIEEALKPFLRSVTDKADNQIEVLLRNKRISINKFRDFCNDFVDGYKQVISVRSLFQYLDLYIEQQCPDTDSESGDLWGMESAEDKSIFFDDWYIDSDRLGDSFGNDFARDENSYILTELTNSVESFQVDTIDEAIERLEENVDAIIIFVNYSPYHLFNDPTRFRWKSESDEFDVPGFVGSYIHRDHQLPTFKYFCRLPKEKIASEKFVLVIHQKSFPRLIQCYLEKHEISSEMLVEYFRFHVQEFSDNQSLIDRYLERPPEWLAKQGDRSEQKQYLESRVLLKIHEKFRLEFSGSHLGFIVPTQEE